MINKIEIWNPDTLEKVDKKNINNDPNEFNSCRKNCDMMHSISSENTPTHIPVLKKEVISFLDIQPEGIYVDGTWWAWWSFKDYFEKPVLKRNFNRYRY